MSENLIVTNKKERIQYIDALRGFTMILVVFAHVELFGFFNFGYETFIGKLFQSFRMPLFFFISGFIAYKSDRIWTWDICWQLTRKKILIQIIPALFFGLIYTYCYLHYDVATFISDPSKAGYWFTFVLLEMFLIYYILNGFSHIICSKVRCSESVVTSCLLILTAIILYLLKLPLKLVPVLDTIGNYTSIHYTFNYFIYFVFGVLARQYFTVFKRLIDNKYFSAIIIIAFTVVFYSTHQVTMNVDLENIVWKVIITLLESIAGFLGIIIVYSFFNKYSLSFDNTTKIGNALQYIGRRTLDVYLLHYFFLPYFPKFGDYLIAHNNIIVELVVGLILSILIIAVCLCVSNIIRISPFLGKYLFGARK